MTTTLAPPRSYFPPAHTTDHSTGFQRQRHHLDHHADPYSNISAVADSSDDSKYKRRPRANSWTAENPLKALAWVSAWYLCSTASIFMSKSLIKQYDLFPLTLTSFNLLVSNVLDGVLLYLPENSPYKIWYLRKIDFRGIAPLGLVGTVTKLLTYWSYGSVPVAITHTAKASTPFFNVLLTRLYYGTTFPKEIYLSLVPIVLGVILASVSELQINAVGLLGIQSAVFATMIGVSKNMYSKHLIREGFTDSINMHFINGLVALALNLPYLISHLSLTIENLSRVPLYMVLGASLLEYLGSVASVLILGYVSELTYSVLGTMKRVVVISNSFWYDKMALTFKGVTGIVLAVGGVAAYQWVKHSMKGKKPHSSVHSVQAKRGRGKSGDRISVIV